MNSFGSDDTTFDITQKYIRTAEAVGEVIGAVFPALPLTLLSPLNDLAKRPPGDSLAHSHQAQFQAPQGRTVSRLPRSDFIQLPIA